MTYVELQFPFTGKTLPSDHAYGLYGAISRGMTEAHSADWLAVETIPGASPGAGVMHRETEARLKIRIPQDRVPLMLKLVLILKQKTAYEIRLGAPQIYLLKPVTALYARIVTIKGFTEPEPFLEAVCRKLDEMGVKGEPVVGQRRVLKVGQHRVVGFGLTIHEMSDESSILLQEQGLGGRRRMGCGIFIPMNHLHLEQGGRNGKV